MPQLPYIRMEVPHARSNSWAVYIILNKHCKEFQMPIYILYIKSFPKIYMHTDKIEKKI